jgi:hypothetical protein
MVHRELRLFSILLVVGVAPFSAFASDPLPGDASAPFPNVNIAMLYEFYQNDTAYGGQLGSPHAPDQKKNTQITANIVVGRYLHAFTLDGYNAGVQVFLPYVTYLGDQHIGINDLGTPAPGLLPSLGPGRADLSKTNGFAQPNFGFYIFPIADRHAGTYFVFSPWIDPPVSSFNKNNTLNGNQNSWTFESEFGFRKTLLGTPTTQNLSIELFEENYVYLGNKNSAFVTPTISADNIPPLYTIGHLIDPEIPDTNPVKAASVTPATFREQPTTELRAYLSYQILPAAHGYVSGGVFQSFGGKQTYKTANTVIDSGSRTQETQLRLLVRGFVSPSVQVTLAGAYDIAAHGTPFARTVEVRLVKYF